MTGTGVTNTSQTYTYAGPAGCANHGASGSSARVTAISGTVNQTYQYDADGNQTLRGDGRTLTYNALNQAVKAVLSSNTTTFQYGPEGDRYLRADNGVLTLYIGKVEITISGGTTTEQKRYLGVAIDLVLANDTRYVLTDHLGSTNVIARVDGTKVEQEAFDAWGNRRDPGTWTQVGTPGSIQTTTHGFTGQEGVEAMGIIHFNGRIYDPQLGRMLQADPLTGPGTQGLNKYSYVANNPLTFTDPSGYSWWGDLLHIVVDVVAFAYGGPWGLAAVEFAWTTAQTGSVSAGLFAAFSAYAGAYIGANIGGGQYGWAAFAQDPRTFLIAATERALANGITQGTLAALQGHGFGSAFRSAAISSFVSSFGPSPVGAGSTEYVEAYVIGGTASALSGGKFSNGGRTALFQLAAQSAAEKITSSIEAHSNERSPPNPTLAGQMAADLNGRLIKSGAIFTAYSTPEDAASAWTTYANETEAEYSNAAEIGTIFSSAGDGYKMNYTYSIGSYNSATGLPIEYGGNWIHTHPYYISDYTQFSGVYAYVDSGVLFPVGGGDLPTSYSSHANAFVAVPDGRIFEWNFGNFQRMASSSMGRTYLSQGEAQLYSSSKYGY